MSEELRECPFCMGEDTEIVPGLKGDWYILSPGLFTSHIIDTVHESWKDAFAATVAKLKEKVQ